MFLSSIVKLDDSEKYKLIVIVSHSELVFAISDAQKSSFIYNYRTISFDTQMSIIENVKKIIFDYSFFSLPFGITSILFKDNRYSFIPSYYFDASKKEELYNSINNNERNKTVFVDSIDYRDVKILCSADKDLFNFLSRHTCLPQFSSHIKPLLTYLYNRKETFARNMYVNINSMYTDIICLENKNLSFCETRINADDSEKLYFILKIWETLEWDQELDQLYLYGEVSEFLSSELSRFIKNKLNLEPPKPKGMDENTEMDNCPLELIIMSS